MGFGFEGARGARRWGVGGGNGGRGSAWREGWRVRCGRSGRKRREEDGDNARIMFSEFSRGHGDREIRQRSGFCVQVRASLQTCSISGQQTLQTKPAEPLAHQRMAGKQQSMERHQIQIQSSNPIFQSLCNITSTVLILCQPKHSGYKLD